MVYRIRCKDYGAAIILSTAFWKHYAVEDHTGELKIPVGNDVFIFLYKGKPKKGEISAKTFYDKYLVPRK